LYLKKGSVVALKGPLGAGKTCFTKGIARGLGVAEEITSPTYTIVSEYEARDPEDRSAAIPFFHIDAYRLNGDEDFSSLGGEEYLGEEGISVVEWSERIAGSLPSDALTAEIEITGEERLIRISRGFP
jgi:tRNA threonylcarbamoyladenosine biosynthesis protein TsaE